MAYVHWHAAFTYTGRCTTPDACHINVLIPAVLRVLLRLNVVVHLEELCWRAIICAMRRTKAIVTAALNGVLTDPAKFAIPVTPVRGMRVSLESAWTNGVVFVSLFGLLMMFSAAIQIWRASCPPVHAWMCDVTV